jgi:hypothetical protein
MPRTSLKEKRNVLYLMLICYNPSTAKSDDDPASLQKEHKALEDAWRSEGVFVSFGGLIPPEYAPILRVKDGDVSTLDGPFAETKELTGGYYVVECKDADDAARQAARIPLDSRSWIEVRQIGLFRAGEELIAKLGG